MHRLGLPALGLVLLSPSAAYGGFGRAVTTSETNSSTGPPQPYVVIVFPLDGDVVFGTPNAKLPIYVEFDNILEAIEVHVDGMFVADCVVTYPPTCTAEVTLTPGKHTIQAVAGENLSNMVNVEVYAEVATTGDTGDSNTGGSTEGSTGGSGDLPGEKGCVCDGSGGASPVALAALGLFWRRRRSH